MRRVLLSLALFAGAWAEPDWRTLEIHSEPPGAALYRLSSSGETFLGYCDQPLRVDVADFSRVVGGVPQVADVQLVARLPEHREQTLTVARNHWNGTYPNSIRLRPDSARVAAADWLRAHRLALVLGTPAALAILLGIGRTLVNRRLVQRARFLESLQADASSDSLIGRRLGEWRVTGRLGRGASADVYAGRSDAGEEVALKVFRQTEVEEAAKFRREVEVSRALVHPNVVRLYDYGEQDGLTWLVQELVTGRSLREHLGGRALSGEEARPLLEGLFAAVAYAHSLGITHRDLKPENVMVTPEGKVKLMDFGLAKHKGVATLTADGSLAGTPAYMAPEQVRGQSRAASIDQYALGVITFEMLVGRRPFPEDDALKVINAHLSKPAPPMGLAPELDRVVARLLEKQPALRYPTVAEAWQALAAALEGRAVEELETGLISGLDLP